MTVWLEPFMEASILIMELLPSIYGPIAILCGGCPTTWTLPRQAPTESPPSPQCKPPCPPRSSTARRATRGEEKPGTPSPAIFIYAGSTAAGLFTVQLAKAAGYTVVTTASPHSFDLVRSYGADVVFDYDDPEVVENVVQVYPMSVGLYVRT